MSPGSQDRGGEGAAQEQLCWERCRDCELLARLQPELSTWKNYILLSTQKSWFSVPVNANGGILFTSSIRCGARWGLAVPSLGCVGTLSLALALQTKCVIKPHGQEQHHLTEVCAGEGQLLGTSRGCDAPCMQAGSLTQASMTSTSSSGGCRVFPGKQPDRRVAGSLFR